MQCYLDTVTMFNDTDNMKRRILCNKNRIVLTIKIGSLKQRV